jgi:hypothetical protein
MSDPRDPAPGDDPTEDPTEDPTTDTAADGEELEGTTGGLT